MYILSYFERGLSTCHMVDVIPPQSLCSVLLHLLVMSRDVSQYRSLSLSSSLTFCELNPRVQRRASLEVLGLHRKQARPRVHGLPFSPKLGKELMVFQTSLDISQSLTFHRRHVTGEQ